MPRKRKLSDLGERCRFCLARDADMIALFDSKQIIEVVYDLQKCTDIEISKKANYPKNVCYVCLYKLEMWGDFKCQFLKTNKTLISHFKLFEQNENDTTLNDSTNADDACLSQDNDRKRVKINEQSFHSKSAKLQNQSVEAVKEIPKKNEVANITLKKTIEEIKVPEQVNEEELNNASANQLSLSDSPSRSGRRSSRIRKIEREASTKRWVERKNALIVATGKQLSESESDSDSQLSPAQKAREEMKQKKIERALKCLETNMTDKYCVKKEDVTSEERKTRSRRSNNAVQEENENSVKMSWKKSSLEEKPKLEVKEKKKEVVKVEKSIVKEEQSKDLSSMEESSINKLSPEKPLMGDNVESDVPMKEITKTVNKSNVTAKNTKSIENEKMDQDNIGLQETMPCEMYMDDERDITKEENNDVYKEDTSESDEDSRPSYDAADQEMLELLNKNVHILEKNNGQFSPQLVTSEITIGNSTYIVTTTLDMPNPKSSDISQKTNGLNADTTSQDGKKIDLMNAVQLQKVNDVKDKAKPDIKRNLGTDVQKCLKIEIEGMEVEALQRVQLDLSHFINEDIRRRLIEEAEGHRQMASKPAKFKDSYENLNYQLRDIIENVLRNTYSTDKLSSASKKIPSLFIKSAEVSPMFQPKVKVAQLDIEKARRDFEIANLDEFEELKKKNRAGPLLSRTIGKRQPIMPKKYDDYSLNLRLGNEEELEKKVGGRLTPNRNLTVATNKISLTNSLINTEKSLDNSTSTGFSIKLKDPAVREIVKTAVKNIDKSIKKDAASSSNKIATPLKTKTLPIASSTPAVTNKLGLGTLGKPKSITQSIPSSQVNQVSKFSITKAAVISSDKPLPSILTPSKKMGSLSASNAKRSNEESKIQLTTPKRERHLCGMCGKELFSMQEASIHMEQHRAEKNNKDKLIKSSTSANTSNGNASLSISTNNTSVGNNANSNSAQKSKPKLMRCKRCQAIVEAKHVKTHVCNSVKYNCDMCECTFGAQHLLIEHKQTHTQAKNKPKISVATSTSSSVTSTLNNVVMMTTAVTTTTPKMSKLNQLKSVSLKDKSRFTMSIQENNDQKKSDKELVNNSEGKTDKLAPKVSHIEESNVIDTPEDEVSGVACFVCDRVFSNEEQMKDHLQMHCEEVSESIEKDNFTCAFCANKFPNEEQLEEHVNVHLNEDGDEKISMMMEAQSSARRDRPRKSHKCDQCSESFSSASLLEMHTALHEEEDEEVMLEPTEDELVDLDHSEEPAGDHVCDVCDEIFDTKAELKIHRESHNGSTHICILCEKPFVSIEELQEHVSTHL